MSRYAADYRYLIAYEINPQGWRKRPGLEGVGGGGVHLIMVIVFFLERGGGGTILICNYHFFWGGKVLIHRTFQKTRVPLLDVINDRSVPNNERGCAFGCIGFFYLTYI